MFLLPSLPSGGAAWRNGEVEPRDGETGLREGEVGWREGERDGEQEEGEREEEEGDGVPCRVASGRADASARMAEESSLESHTFTN